MSWILVFGPGRHDGGQTHFDLVKTLRRSFDTASNKLAIHMVNAYVHENHAVAGDCPGLDR
jgi:hypothetical protein